MPSQGWEPWALLPLSVTRRSSTPFACVPMWKSVGSPVIRKSPVCPCPIRTSAPFGPPCSCSSSGTMRSSTVASQPKRPQVLDGVHHRGESALHVVDAPAVELLALLAGLELPLLAGDDVDVAVEQDLRLPGPHPHHQGGQLALGARPAVARRLQAPGPEPPVDKVHGRLGDARRVRPVAHELAGKREHLRLVLDYRQIPPPESLSIRRTRVYTLRHLRLRSARQPDSVSRDRRRS